MTALARLLKKVTVFSYFEFNLALHITEQDSQGSHFVSSFAHESVPDLFPTAALVRFLCQFLKTNSSIRSAKFAVIGTRVTVSTFGTKNTCSCPLVVMTGSEYLQCI